MKISRLVKWVVSIVLLFFVLLTIYRFFFYEHYKPGNYAFPESAFIMGLRVDFRAVSILGLAMLLLCSIPLLDPFRNKRARIFWNVFLSLLFFLALLFYIVDFYHYDYLHQRLNASVLNY